MDIFTDANLLTFNTWSASATGTTDYHTDYTFDRNGNILTLNRNGLGGQIDELTYAYKKSGTMLDHNRLYHVNDGVGFQNVNDFADSMRGSIAWKIP